MTNSIYWIYLFTFYSIILFTETTKGKKNERSDFITVVVECLITSKFVYLRMVKPNDMFEELLYDRFFSVFLQHKIVKMSLLCKQKFLSFEYPYSVNYCVP